MWEEFQCIGDSVFVGTRDVALVVPVVLHSRSYVESGGTAFVPCPAVALTVMDDDFASCWSKWGGIEIKVPMDDGVC